MQINVNLPTPHMGSNAPMVKVWPKNDSIRKLIKHPTGVAFSSDPQFDPVEWPQDQFTTRRLADGDVLDHAPHVAMAPVPKVEKVSAKKTVSEEKE